LIPTFIARAKIIRLDKFLTAPRCSPADEARRAKSEQKPATKDGKVTSVGATRKGVARDATSWTIIARFNDVRTFGGVFKRTAAFRVKVIIFDTR